jgi:hypothetical protein
METNKLTHQENFTSASSLKKMFSAGLIVGALDIISALIDYYTATGKDPIIIFKYISMGLLGTGALAGGTGTVLLGLILHFIIAFSFTVFFWLLYPKIRQLPKHIILTGIVYGIFIWAVMNFIVVPSSQIPGAPFNLAKSLKAMLILIFMIGLPLSYLASRFFGRGNEEKV